MHGIAFNKREYKNANKYHAIITSIVNYLKNNDNLSELASFLYDASEGVRLWAAVSLLPIMKNEAIRTLQIIEKGKGFMSITAHYKLRELGKEK